MLAAKLQEHFGDTAVVLVPRCFGLLRTLTGIDVCAQRVLMEVKKQLDAHPALEHLSLVGFSMGGLICRYMAGILYAREFYGLKPLNFLTLASPHLGIRFDTDVAMTTRLIRAVARLIGGRSALQMLSGDEETHILALMACRRSAFSMGLAAFERRVLYASTYGDRSVPFWSAFIAPWQAHEPSGPPMGVGGELRIDEVRYPHIEWEGTLSPPPSTPLTPPPNGRRRRTSRGSADGARCEEVATAPLAPIATSVKRAANRHPPDTLTWTQSVATAFLIATACCVLPLLWLTVLLPLGLLVRIMTASSPSATPALDAELRVLEPPGDDGDGRSEANGDPAGARPSVWRPAALQAAVTSSGASCAQEWMAVELNSLTWVKVAVRFSIVRDGLTALVTHGHIVVRHKWLNRVGMDVLEHVVSQMLTPPTSGSASTAKSARRRVAGRHG